MLINKPIIDMQPSIEVAKRKAIMDILSELDKKSKRLIIVSQIPSEIAIAYVINVSAFALDIK